MDTIDLDFITTAAGDEGRYHISGIPDKLWEMFRESAKESMPEKGDLAWASVLTEIIQKHVLGDVYTYIMTDIPTEAKEAFGRVANQADLHPDDIIRLLFKQAMDDKLHILSMINQEGRENGYRVIVIAGLSELSWKKWTEVASGARLAPEELIGMMFEGAAAGDLTLTAAPQDPHNYEFNGRTPDG